MWGGEGKGVKALRGNRILAEFGDIRHRRNAGVRLCRMGKDTRTAFHSASGSGTQRRELCRGCFVGKLLGPLDF